MLSKLIAILGLVVGSFAWADEASVEAIARSVRAGSWQAARDAIRTRLTGTQLGQTERDALLFLEERMRRIDLDFDQSRAQVLSRMQMIVPEVDDLCLTRWEAQHSVEYLTIDGQRRYFSRAAPNVFRVNPEARGLKARQGLATNSPVPFLRENLTEILAEHGRGGSAYLAPKRFRVRYSIAVKPDAVPAGEVIRAWLPLALTTDRQEDVRLISAEPKPKRVSDGPALGSVYLEQAAKAGQPTRFAIVYEYTVRGCYRAIERDRVRPVDSNDVAVARWLGERFPHLGYTEELRRLSREVVGQLTNRYDQARALFLWVNRNIPWASAREYSTIDSLSQYALEHRWGDCGIQTMLFMVLCRLNGIPARWESGWTTAGGQDMHDWCQIYLEPYGWLPVDCTFGLMPTQDDRIRWFYFGNTDSYRLTVNSDYGQPLVPPKTFFRSEPVDFQRGEVEWRGGNLYFNQWSWEFHAQELQSEPEIRGQELK
jgi:transglutaminase-like putative cysteine protease